MEFWSKGLGKRTIALYLSKSESIKSGETLYLKGQMEAPVSWEYIMPMNEDDIVDFFALLKDPAVADYLYSSPNRWRLYRGLVAGGISLGWVILTSLLKGLFSKTTPEEEAIQVPPATVRRRDRPLRRRLGSRSTAAPGVTPADSEDDLAAQIEAEVAAEIAAVSVGGAKS
jgi:hypothetical protein